MQCIWSWVVCQVDAGVGGSTMQHFWTHAAIDRGSWGVVGYCKSVSGVV